ncbi:MAG: dual specificity protein phosphatase family protein [Planctomycetes bacterium]|nr:dual specificity protein phosphatase family protein [Planctomycetota bacterium]
MKWTRRSWLLVCLLLASIAVLTLHLTAEHLNYEPPNYSRIDDGLYLGGYVQQPPPAARAVLNLCESEDPYQAEIHAWHPIRDAAPAPSLDWLRQQVAFIEAERAAGRVVYVHCHAGVSRGAMVTTAYLMARDRRSRDETLVFLRTRRPQVRPNPAFMELLLEWEKQLKSERSG